MTIEAIRVAYVVQVGPQREGGWDIEVRCPYCHGRHWHGWRNDDLAPGLFTAHCDGGRYVVPSPPPRVPVPGFCDWPLPNGSRCRRRVRRGVGCHHHRRCYAAALERMGRET
jgi:hypothetical protein